ncbi:MAG TPA: nitronate monooxygenase [Micropepsaceae bacterium]|nr:nitronate monooxygenase [Micropepsaceae bacterium]
MNRALDRASGFSARFGLRLPILLAPMAGVPSPSLSIAVATAGGLGACGVLMMRPDEILAWANEVRSNSNGAFQLNTWIPDPAPMRDFEHEARVREFLGNFGPPVPPSAGDTAPPDFAAQCEAMLQIGPPVISSVMGLFPTEFVQRLKARGIAWFAAVSTVKEGKTAEAAGADAIIAQGSEAGGHRACFDANSGERTQVGLFSLLPALADAVSLPVIATGGIADARGVAAALLLGASAVQIGTAFLRCPEARIHPAWAAALAKTAPEDTVVSRVFSGRAGRSIATDYVMSALSPGAPAPAPYPVQRALTAPMRQEAQKIGDVQRMQAWAGQSAGLGESVPATALVERLWAGARALLDQ